MARYLLMGYEIVGSDDNQRNMALEEQRRTGGATIVYETDDIKEAETIVNAGGFFRDRDNFIAVQSFVDRENTVSGPGTNPLGKVPPPRPMTFPQKGN